MSNARKGRYAYIVAGQVPLFAFVGSEEGSSIIGHIAIQQALLPVAWQMVPPLYKKKSYLSLSFTVVPVKRGDAHIQVGAELQRDCVCAQKKVSASTHTMIAPE